MILTLADGRRLGYLEQGDPTGRPVVALHGTPGSRLTGYPYEQHLVDNGIRLITYDRPGCGDSDRAPGRSVADAAADICALLDSLGIDRAAVLGGSGGGPHALAMATLAPERCTLVHCFVGVAPIDADGLDFFAGMDPENVRKFRAAAQGLAVAEAEIAQDFEDILDRARNEDPEKLLGALKLPEADLAILREIGAHAVAATIEGGKHGVGGFLDDFVAIAKPWGFDPRRASAPVLVSYGAHDVNVPPGHGAWLAANVPNKEVRVKSEGGHLSTPQESLARLVELAEA